MKSGKEVWKRLLLILLGFSLTLTLIYAIGLISNTAWEANLPMVKYGSLAFGDINNDNYSDLIVTGCLATAGQDCNAGAVAQIYLGNGTGLNNGTIWEQNLTGVGHSSTAFGDINNDGKLDLVITGCTSATDAGGCIGNILSKIYINNGTALIEDQIWQQNLTGIWRGNLALADINGDGKIDLAIIGLATTQIAKIYINNGSTLIADSIWQNNLTGLDDGALTFADINNDGWLDLGTTGADSSNNKHTYTYINNGSTFNENPIWEQNLTGASQSSMIFGDYNNDGWMDMVFMGCCDYLFTYTNNGTTLIRSQKNPAEGGDLSGGGLFDGSIALGDYDNDGNLDFVGIGRESGRSRVYKNNGSGYFVANSTDGSIIQTDDFRHGALAWNDIDNDRDLDLIIEGYSEYASSTIKKIYISNSSLYLNNSLPYAPPSFQNYTIGQRVFFGWGNGTDNETNSTGLYYNLRIGTASGRNDIISGIFGGSSGGQWRGGGPANGYFGNMMQRRNTTLPLSGFQANTNYYWSVQTIDTGLAKSAWSAEQVFTTSSDITFPTIVVLEPTDNLYTNSSIINFTALAVDNNNITNVTLWANFTGTFALNVTNSSAYNNTNYTFTRTLADGHYLWAIRACDALNNCNSSLNRTLNIDTTAPSVSLSTPANETTQTSSSTVTFTWSVTETNPSNCTLYVSDINKGTTSASTLSAALSNGAYTWYVSCTDLASNQARSTATRALTVSYTAPPDTTTTGGGGGGGGTVTTTKFDADLSKTEEKSITGIKGTARTFTLDGTTQHKITLNDVTKDTVTLTIESQPITIILTVGETKKIDIDRDGTKDIAVTLNSIISGAATITIKKLPPPVILPEKKEEAKKLEHLFDVKVEIPDKYKIIFPGEQVTAKITSLQVNGERVDVNLAYYILDQQNNIITERKDTRAIETTTEIIQTLSTPESITPGTYYFNVTLHYGNLTATGQDHFQIQTKIRYIPSWIQKNYKTITISSTIGIAAIIISIILFRTLKKKEERDISKLRRELKKDKIKK